MSQAAAKLTDTYFALYIGKLPVFLNHPDLKHKNAVIKKV